MRFEDYKTFRTAVGGRLLQLEIGKVCEQTNGQVMVKYGDTVVNVTAVMNDKPRDFVDFFPLNVEFEEKMYAAGKIPGGFIRREGRPSEKAILTSRLIDRPIRPLFPKGFYNDVQVVAGVMSIDHDCAPEFAGMIGSSVALSISDIPFDGPTGSVIVGRINGEFIINPTLEEREESEMHLVVSGTKDAIMMVEAGANEIPEDIILEAILFGHEEIKKIVEFIEMIVSEVGKEKKEVIINKVPEDIDAEVRAFAEGKMRTAIQTFDKMERLENMEAVENETKGHFEEIFPEEGKNISAVLYSIKKEQVRSMILDEGIRPDNRKLDEVRPIWVETGVLPRVHGTGLFKRGQTQALSVATLGPIGDSQRIDGIGEEVGKRYMHHYNFPPFSVGEAKPMRSPGRREIGHGALAERALLPVLPSEEDFPYAIRVVSEILSSNGSSSMASTCGSTLALMDAGVPIKAPVSGIAMGLIERVEEDGSSKIAILSDIQGMEDFLGDMDFKVTGTEKGVTAIQMDIKVHGLSRQILEDALTQAKEGRMHIMNEMMTELEAPREDLSPYAPRILSMQIDPEKIGAVIGQGGKVINKMIADYEVKIDIDDSGLVFVAGDMDGVKAAMKNIELLTKEVEVGEVYLGKVVSVRDFGAFIELLPGKDGLLHISKMAKSRVNKVSDVMDVGDTIEVKVNEVDSQGKISLVRTDI
ncbi:MAG: polyribonucleotide nucleotidyltransferase [Anaerovoracaceae bacterium]